MSLQSTQSSTRQQQLLRDRQRTKAISLYLDDIRQELLVTLPKKVTKDRNLKRKELERIARLRFGLESEDQQAQYISRVNCASSHVASDLSAGAGTVTGFRCSGVEFAPRKRMRSKMPSSTSKQVVVVVSRASSSSPGHTQLRDPLMQTQNHLIQLYGEPGALQTLASGLHILSAMDMSLWVYPEPIKVAVVAGMAAKLTQACTDEEHIVKLWAKIACKRNEKHVRSLERLVFIRWARQGLMTDEYLQPWGQHQ